MQFNLKDLRLKLIVIILVFDVLSIGLGFTSIIAIRIGFYIFLMGSLMFGQLKKNIQSHIIILFIGLISISSVLNSSNIQISIDSALKTNLSLAMYLFGFWTIDSMERLMKLSRAFFGVLFLAIVIIALSNVFNFGEVNYHDDSILFGASGVNIVKNVLLYGILSVPYIISKIKGPHKFLFYGVLFIGVVLVLLSTKRTAMGLLMLYILLFLFYNREKIVKTAITFTFIGVVGLFYFQDLITERINNRASRFDISQTDELDKEWRVIETDIVLNNFEKGDWTVKLLGSETFNELETYNLDFMFHNDFAVVLGGLGIAGLILYLLFFLSLFCRVPSKNQIGVEYIVILKWLYYCLVLSLVIFGVAGNFKTLGASLGTCLLGIGAIHGLIYKKKL